MARNGVTIQEGKSKLLSLLNATEYNILKIQQPPASTEGDKLVNERETHRHHQPIARHPRLGSSTRTTPAGNRAGDFSPKSRSDFGMLKWEEGRKTFNHLPGSQF